jgi:hemolysin activation/secretion protein
MNKLLFVSCLLLSVLSGHGQVFSPLPPEVAPKGAPAGPTPPLIVKSKSPRSPSGDKPINPDQPNLTIQAVVIVKNRAEIQEAGVPNAKGVQIKDIPILEQPDFRQMVEYHFLGKIITENTIRDLQDAIILYCRTRGKLLVDVILPEQNIDNGALQMWFLEGKVGNVTVKNEGHKWFQDQFIKSNVRLRPAEPLDSVQLNKDLDWLNNNPFREVEVNFKPGEKLELSDVELNVNDRIPFRPYIGYEDSGTQFAGPDRLIGGFNWGNALWLDHQLNYQYTTDVDFDLVKAHSMSYVAPLPWRHTLMLYGAYVDAKARFGQGFAGTTGEGNSWQISGRYSVPLPNVAKYRHQVAAGFDFKRSDNTLLAGGRIPLISSNGIATDVAQFVLSYTGTLPDKYGKTSAGLEMYYSPGDLTSGNNNTDFNLLRPNSKADYFYGRLNAERVTRLPWNFSWLLSGWGQYSTERLPPSEELALGGYNTIRGYDERVLIGDDGWIIDNEIRTPPISLVNWLNIPTVTDQLQFLVFFDYGHLHVKNPDSQSGDVENSTLYSTGVGLRYSLRHNLSVRFDYGFPLTEKDLNERKSRMHFGALLSF